MADVTWDDRAVTLEGARAAVWGDPNIDATAAHLASLGPLRLVDAPDGAVVLDVGCGIGRLTIPVALAYPRLHVIGTDTSPRMLGWALKAQEWAGASNVAWWLSDAHNLHGNFSGVVGCWSVLTFQHLEPDAQRSYAAAVASCLGHGGRFRLQWVHQGGRGPLSHPVPEATMLAWFADAGLTVEEVDGDTYTPDWRWVTAVKP